MRVGVFGGTFDPPHNGHLALCLHAWESLSLGRIFLFASNNPLKPSRGASAPQRFMMASLLAEALQASGCDAEASDWELRQPGPSYTLRLLGHLKKVFPGHELVLLVGEDSYRQFPLWYGIEELLSLCEVAVFRRKGDLGEDVPVQPGWRVRFVDFDQLVSSTEVRERLRLGRSIEGMLPPSIAAYIKREGLYRD